MHPPRLVRIVTCSLASAALIAGAAGCPGGDDTSAACADILPGELVITEVFADHDAPTGSSGADEGKEWFEIYNSSGAPIDLAGLTIEHSRPDGAMDHAHVMQAATIPAGEYLVLGNVLPEFLAGHLDYGYGDDLGDMFNADGGRIAITCGGDVIDEAAYEDAETGKAVGFDGGAPPDYTANDDLSQWCNPPEETAYEFELANFGTPGAVNFDCEVVTEGMCDDGGVMRATITPEVGDLIITEIHPNPSGDDDVQEWFEVYATRAVDLNGLGVARSTTTTPSVVASSACIEVAAASYAVLARSNAPATNGNLPQVNATYGAISLVDDGDLRISMGTTLIDAFDWANAPSNATYGLDPGFLDGASNDMENYWCTATVPWFVGPPVGDDGSPGAANEECTILPSPGNCFDPPNSTSQRAIVVPTAGQLVITELFPTPSTMETVREWFEARATASFDLNGLKLQRTGATPGTNQILSANCLPVTSGSYALFARQLLPADNGMIPQTVDARFTFSMIDTCQTTCGVQIATGADLVLDAVTWDNATTGASRQLDPAITDATGNDVLTEWCDDATNLYNTTDTGTPKAVNLITCP